MQYPHVGPYLERLLRMSEFHSWISKIPNVAWFWKYLISGHWRNAWILKISLKRKETSEANNKKLKKLKSLSEILVNKYALGFVCVTRWGYDKEENCFSFLCSAHLFYEEKRRLNWLSSKERILISFERAWFLFPMTIEIYEAWNYFITQIDQAVSLAEFLIGIHRVRNSRPWGDGCPLGISICNVYFLEFRISTT